MYYSYQPMDDMSLGSHDKMKEILEKHAQRQAGVTSVTVVGTPAPAETLPAILSWQEPTKYYQMSVCGLYNVDKATVMGKDRYLPWRVTPDFQGRLAPKAFDTAAEAEAVCEAHARARFSKESATGTGYPSPQTETGPSGSPVPKPA